MKFSQRLYCLLLCLYPARFREEYGGPLERQFLDEYRELRGIVPRALFWLRAIADLGTSIPAEILREMRQDLAHAMRVYRRRPLTVGLALIALSLTIGVTTGVFSVINALLLRSLPFHDPDRLVEMENATGDDAPAAFHRWAASRPYLTDAAAYRIAAMTLDAPGSGAARRVQVAETSSNFFRLLGCDPLIGRGFADGEDEAGRDQVAIVGYALWQQLGGDPRLLGSTIRLNGVPLTVIGIGPRGLDYPLKTAIWAPSVFDTELIFRDHGIVWTVDGRLRPGISLRAASSQYRAESLREFKSPPADGVAGKLKLISLRDQLAGDVRQSAFVLFGIVVFVLLAACANVAHLLLSRITERQKELELRAALGASRARLMQQLITETTVLTVGAAAAGLLVANWATRIAAAVQPPSLSAQEYSVLDWGVVLFAVGLAVLTGLVFGVLPAGFIRRMRPGMDGLRIGSGSSAGVSRLRALLVGIQAAFTVVLLAGALTMCRSFLKLAGTDLGLSTGHVLTLNVSVSGTPREKDGAGYFREAVEKLRRVPGVEAAGAIENLPLSSPMRIGFRFKVDGYPEEQMGLTATATAGYFRAMGTRIVAGRDFSADEEAFLRPVAVVNEAFAREFDSTERVLGRRVVPPWKELPPLTIVGIARNQLYSPTDETLPMIYYLPNWIPTQTISLVARVRGDVALYQAVCRDAVRGVDPRVPVYDVKTLDERLRSQLARPRFYATAVLFLGGFTLLLAVIGIYGVASFSITQRTHEIGVRLAIGAHPRRLRAMLLREGLLPLACGLTVGVGAAMEFGKVVRYLVAGADTIGFAGCAAGAFVLAAAAAIALWSATRRVARLDPIRVLRAE